MSPIPMKLSEGGHDVNVAELLFLIYIWATSVLLLIISMQARYRMYWDERMSRMTDELELRIEILDREEAQAEDEPPEDLDTPDGYIKVD